MTLSFQLSRKAFEPLIDIYEALGSPPNAPVFVTPSRDRLLFRLVKEERVYAEKALYLGSCSGQASGAFSMQALLRPLRDPSPPANRISHADLVPEAGTLTIEGGHARHRTPLTQAPRDNRPPEPRACVQTLAAFDTKALRQALETAARTAGKSGSTLPFRQAAFTPGKDGRLYLRSASSSFAVNLPLEPKTSTLSRQIGLPLDLADAWLGNPPTDPDTYLSLYQDENGRSWTRLHGQHSSFTAPQAEDPLPTLSCYEHGPSTDAAFNCSIRPRAFLQHLQDFHPSAPLTLARGEGTLLIRQELPDGTVIQADPKLRSAPSGELDYLPQTTAEALGELFLALEHLPRVNLHACPRTNTLALVDPSWPETVLAILAAPPADTK